MASLSTFVAAHNQAATATVPGDKREWFGTVAGPASYTTGGDAISAGPLGFTDIDFVNVGSAVAGTAFAVYNPATGKLLIFTADGTQATNASDQSALVFPVHIVGR